MKHGSAIRFKFDEKYVKEIEFKEGLFSNYIKTTFKDGR